MSSYDKIQTIKKHRGGAIMQKDYKAIISEKLRELTDSSVYTRAYISERVGVDQTVISRHLSGERPVPVDKLAAYAELFGVSVDYLIGRGDILDKPEQQAHVIPNLSERIEDYLESGTDRDYRLFLVHKAVDDYLIVEEQRRKRTKKK